MFLSGATSLEELLKLDLKKIVENYLLDGGMNKQELEAFESLILK